MPTLVVIPGVVMKAGVLQSGRAVFESDSSIARRPRASGLSILILILLICKMGIQVNGPACLPA